MMERGYCSDVPVSGVGYGTRILFSQTDSGTKPVVAVTRDLDGKKPRRLVRDGKRSTVAGLHCGVIGSSDVSFGQFTVSP